MLWPLEEVAVKVESLIPTARDRLVAISDKARLTEAAERLGNGRIALLAVCDDAGVLAGVVGMTDIISRIGGCQGGSCAEMVATVMSRDVTCCVAGDALMDVWAVMKKKGFSHIPVVDRDRRPLGMLTARDVLQALLGEVEHEETLLRDYVMGIGYH